MKDEEQNQLNQQWCPVLPLSPHYSQGVDNADYLIDIKRQIDFSGNTLCFPHARFAKSLYAKIFMDTGELGA